MTLRIPVYSIINNSRRDLSIHLNSIDFTLVQISSHVWFLEKKERSTLAKVKPRNEGTFLFPRKTTLETREREKERVSDQDDEGRKIEKNSYLTLDFVFRELILGFRLDRWLVGRGWDRVDSIDRLQVARRHAPLSLSLSIDFHNRAISRGRGRWHVCEKKRKGMRKKGGEKKSGTPPIAACFLRFSRKTTSALLEMRPRRDTQRSTLFSWWKVVETVVPL